MSRLRCRNSSSLRHGLTLIELLVVVGVVSVLAAIVLPSIKSVLTDRKSSQAAIVVKNFIEAAQARAIGKNRTVSVVVERLSGRTFFNGTNYVSETATTVIGPSDTNFVPYNACIRLSLAEEPLPVTEQMLPAPVSIFPRRPNDFAASAPAIPSPYGITEELIDPDQLLYPAFGEVRIFRVTSSGDVYRMLSEYLVAGSEISFGSSKRRFSIVTPTSPQVHLNHCNAAGNNSTIWFAVMNERGFEGGGERALEPYDGALKLTEDQSLLPPLPIVPPPITAFKIYSRPKPIYSEMVQLPRGMCIDLSLSGFANDMPRNNNSQPPNQQPVFDSGTSPMDPPLSDYRFRFASDWIANSTVPLSPSQLRPVYITFGPDGTLSHLWANERQNDPGYVGNLARVDVAQDIFLHIGKIDQVAFPFGLPARTKETTDAMLLAGQRQNLLDSNSYVIRLSPKSGTITASPAVSIETQIGILGLNPTTLSLGDLVELNRRGTYSSNVTAQ